MFQILSKSRRNMREGFCKFLHQIVYEQAYLASLTKESHRVTKLVSEQYKVPSSLKEIFVDLNQEI